MGARFFAARPGLPGQPVSLTSFTGRRAELVQLRRLLAEHRLVTIAGAAGLGKTRLANELARGAERSGFVAVESVTDPRLLLQAIAEAASLPAPGSIGSLDELVGELRREPLLLVLDGCEHLVDACAELTEALLLACPRLVVLATSREPLAIPGEVTWGLQRMAPADAQALFIERCTLSRPDLELQPEDVRTAARIAARLDGVPLALELAALRLRSLSLADLEERLDDWLRLSTGGVRTRERSRQTLRAAAELTHHLLDAAEQALIGRLSVFQGPFTLTAAEATCGFPPLTPGAVLGLLGSLVEKSLVVLEPGGYRLPGSVRSYGWELVQEGDAAEELRRRHAAGCLLRLEAGWRRPLELELDNLRCALEWSHAADQDLYVRLCAALGPHWLEAGLLVEGWERVTSALALGHASDATAESLRRSAARLALARGDVAGVAELDAGAEVEIPAWEPVARAVSALERGDAEGAAEAFRACFDRGGLAAACGLEGLAELAARRHDHERALRLEGAAGAARTATGAARPPFWPAGASALQASAKALGASTARAAFQRGEQMSAEDLAAYLDGEARPGDPSGRELEIAKLVAEGLTNRQIAGRLHLSVRTVEGHVERLRNKLGFQTRSRLASWMIEKQVAIE